MSYKRLTKGMTHKSGMKHGKRSKLKRLKTHNTARGR